MNKEVLDTANTKQVAELGEDIKVTGPGLMLSEARKKLSLSVEDVSNRLNFRTNLVDEIEQDIFDLLLPATFNRGYLRNYAKLVSVDVDEVLSAYDMLGVAKTQRNEMQSFSHLTVKQAEHSRLMWFSYFIVALLFGLMMLWWLQEPKLPVNLFNESQEQQVSNDVSDVSVVKKLVDAPELAKAKTIELDEVTKPTGSVKKHLKSAIAEQKLESVLVKQLETKTKVQVNTETELVPELSTAVFTFLGDCWVNIYDTTGERIAWGVKKAGYVMSVTGKTPLKITLGKPELATIIFNGKPVDMSSFNAGNITKFTLPLIAQ